MSSTNDLKTHFFQTGKIEWIGVRPARGKEMIELESVELLQHHGLDGDKAGQRPGGKRQVTLIQAEYFPVMESLLDKDKISAQSLRRNIVVSGINLSILLKHSLKINNAILEITGNCAPCKKMEQVLGFGAFNAMRNHGGVNAAVLEGGHIQVGDQIEVHVDKTTKDSRQVKLF